MAATKLKQPTHGGARPGAGTKPAEGGPFTAMIKFRCTEEQKEKFDEHLGAGFLRGKIDEVPAKKRKVVA